MCNTTVTRAEELYEIVKDLPYEAKPSCVVGYNFERNYVIVQMPEMGSEPVVEERFMFPDDAASLFESSMQRWLIQNRGAYKVNQYFHEVTTATYYVTFGYCEGEIVFKHSRFVGALAEAVKRWCKVQDRI